MKLFCRVLFALVFLLAANGNWSPVYAQKSIKKFFQKISPLSKGYVSLPGYAIIRQVLAASRANLAAKQPLAEIAPLFAPYSAVNTPRPLTPAPENIKRAVFTLQSSPKSHGKGSAFAMNIDGEIWGITARHLLDDIGLAPFMAVQDTDGNIRLFQVHIWRQGNVHGADIAAFAIPPAALPYITPLKADYRLPASNSVIQSAGFSSGHFGWFNHIGVLFSSNYRILTRHQDFPVRSGYCGSPLLNNGKVIGVFAGVTPAETAKNSHWYSQIFSSFPVEITSFNLAVPVAWVKELVQQSKDQAGISLVFDGHPLGLLRPDETIESLQVLRNGRLLKQMSPYPFMDYTHLERFLEWNPQEDTFRLLIQRGDRSSPKRYTYGYEWNLRQGITLFGKRPF